MGKRKLRGVLIDAQTARAKATVLDDSLESFYKALHCDNIDIVNREIAGLRFDIVCDDEALLKEHPRASAYNSRYEMKLFGSLFITGQADEAGELTSLTREQVRLVLSRCKPLPIMNDLYYQTGPMPMVKLSD